jgi:hypothetical protein
LRSFFFPAGGGGLRGDILCALSVLNTLNLDERGAWGSDALATLVAQVATPGNRASVTVT